MNRHQNEVHVVEYNSDWPSEFNKIKELLWPQVSKYATAIEHVGSTSVIGLAAKPVIDIDIIVKDNSASKLVIGELVKIGFEHRGNLGIEGREAFTQLSSLYKHNLYVCIEGVLALENHLNFRDYLRENDEAVNEYSSLKLKLARETNDMNVYIEGKTNFISRVLSKTGLDSNQLAEIEEINKNK
jgi:GrpB-like predicted nucleotidyltransferase (UPF0157 family)